MHTEHITKNCYEIVKINKDRDGKIAQSECSYLDKNKGRDLKETRYRTSFWVTGWNLIIVTEYLYLILDENLQEKKRQKFEEWNSITDNAQVMAKSFSP